MKIAITGTIGSGKSTASEYLRNKGYHVFDCDAYNRYLLEEGNPSYEFIKENFSECFTDSLLDKKKVASVIFSDNEKKKKLEDFVHPLIVEKMLEEMEEYSLFFAEVPLLFECDLDIYFDLCVLVCVNEETALKRLENRGFNKEEASARINKQMTLELKKKRADEIVYNDLDLANLYRQIEELLDKYVR
ncbi:MAG: dephospho-CoA kinase [Erysipelotrichaceae bacterium]|nr:dephospho-CoA kinase [Erysipelotrichaceae bacterium]